MQKGAPVDIDHVILGIDDLDRGMREFESRTGVRPKRGGEHPGRGTRNALVALGGGRYLEILAPTAAPQSTAPRDPRLEHVELTLVGWALQTRAIAKIVEQVRSAGIDIQTPTLGSRRAPDGTLLAQSAAVDQLGVTPFFIEWSTDTPHPSTTSPVGLHAGHDGARASSARTLAATFQNCRISHDYSQVGAFRHEGHA
jgi:hypothetical protein